MINRVFQLCAPRTFSVRNSIVDIDNKVLIRPRFMSICHADQRYYQGQRPPEIMRAKLPMALIHECCGEVLYDASGAFSAGELVAMIPNVPGKKEEGIYENYSHGAKFLSSGCDGFMREVVDLPADRIVSVGEVPAHIAAISEFVSVAVHAFRRFNAIKRVGGNRLAVIGDGSLAYVMSCVLKKMSSDIEIVVIGHNPEKLALFTFATERYLSYDAPFDLTFDFAFECAGGRGSESAIEFAITHIAPQGAILLMGVTELSVGIRTRDVLEKGITLVGCSRSGRDDFEQALQVMADSEVQRRLIQIIYNSGLVGHVDDIKRAFAEDTQTPFKTVFEWGL